MTQRNSRDGVMQVSRRMLGVLVIFCVNLAAMPCTMALETSGTNPHCLPAVGHETAHQDSQSLPDCLTMQSNCCGLEEAAMDSRSGVEENQCDDSPVFATVPAWPSLNTVATLKNDTKPPDPDGNYPPLNVLLCVYLD